MGRLERLEVRCSTPRTPQVGSKDLGLHSSPKTNGVYEKKEGERVEGSGRGSYRDWEQGCLVRKFAQWIPNPVITSQVTPLGL